MSLKTHQYPCDTEFLKLIARYPQVDLVTAALEIARYIDPSVSFSDCHDWIEARADELRADVAGAESEWEVLTQLGRHLCGRHGLNGDQMAFLTPDGSCLQRVIQARRGIPISLSVLYMAVAGRVGIELSGVSAPLHFLTRYDGLREVLYVDAFTGGRVMTERECLVWLEAKTGMGEAELLPTLQPASHRAIMIRMLNNLKSLYVQQQDWRGAWQVQHRLTTLMPSCYAERRDLALLALRSGRPGQAIDLLRSCLNACPESERELLHKSSKQAMSNVCCMN